MYLISSLQFCPNHSMYLYIKLIHFVILTYFSAILLDCKKFALFEVRIVSKLNNITHS